MAKESVEAVERVIADLTAKRAACAQHGTDLQNERAGIAFKAHTGDDQARARLDALNVEISTHASELASLDAALKAAAVKLDEARAAAAAAADRKEALALRAELGRFADAAARLDAAFGEIGVVGGEFYEIAARMRTLGAGVPSAAQVDSLGLRCLWTAIGATPWRRIADLPMPAPHERRSFGQLTAAWCKTVEQQIAARLAVKKEEAA